MAARGLTWGEVISAASAAALLVLMVAVAWYGVDGIPSRAGSFARVITTETGWEGLTGLRWLVLLTVLLAFTSVAVHALGPPRQTLAVLRLALLFLATATAVGVVVRVLIDLPAADRVVDQKLGALFGMAAAIGVASGAAQAIREQRDRLAAAAASAGPATSGGEGPEAQT